MDIERLVSNRVGSQSKLELLTFENHNMCSRCPNRDNFVLLEFRLITTGFVSKFWNIFFKYRLDKSHCTVCCPLKRGNHNWVDLNQLGKSIDYERLHCRRRSHKHRHSYNLHLSLDHNRSHLSWLFEPSYDHDRCCISKPLLGFWNSWFHEMKRFKN